MFKEYMKKFIGKKVDVLVEEVIDGYSYGHTGEFLHVKCKGEYPHNEIISFEIETVSYPYCIGKKIK